ncbi:hypothetical protein EOI86_00320 [Hwanghaeella grinnelliae]|uniref:Uncharacterized protein n=1 Tax=Hwanghaeella grinnelliae TaxID=2500179 RepID=A0A437QTE9_9PROT|nr:hypothetical protein [Hwanghaeella grinnelliae]RVU37787.1 hypothetical protein EOI86_00320 [Hwanghaeella grinnelliae]
MADDNSLLQPSLRAGQPKDAPYSITAGIWISFFGGIWGALAYTGLNSMRLRRLSRDLPYLAIAAGMYIALLLALAMTEPGRIAQAELADLFGEQRGLRFLLQFVGVLFVGFGYLLHKSDHRAAGLTGRDRPSAWRVGLIIVVISTVIHLVTLIPLFAPLSGAAE